MSFFEDASLVLIPSGIKNQKIYSVKPTDGTGDLTFSRASNATRVDSNGLIEKVRRNLFTYSEDMVAGKVDVNVTATNNVTTAPDGTTTAASVEADAVTGAFIRTSVNFGAVNFSVYLKYDSQQFVQIIQSADSGCFVNFDIQNGVIGDAGAKTTNVQIENVGNGWYRCSAYLNASGAGTLRVYHVSSLTAGFGGSSTTIGNTYFTWGWQVEDGDIATDYIATTTTAVSVGPVSGLPRLDYLNTSCPRLLLEPQRTNVVPFSEQFDNAAWTKSNTTITANAVTSPSGYQDAEKLIANTTSGVHLIQRTYAPLSATSYTLSTYAKAGEYNFIGLQIAFGGINAYASFNLSTGVVHLSAGGATATIQNAGNGWYRCLITATTASVASSVFNIRIENDGSLNNFVGNNVNGIYVWGAQLEAGAYATSYIPTLGASVTRVADAASKTGISSLIGQTEGTLFVEVQRLNVGVSAVALQFNDGTNNNRVQIEIGSGGQTFAICSNAGSTTCLITGPTLTLGQTYKIAFSYKVNDFKLFVDGVSGGVDTSGAVPVSMSRLDLASEAGISYAGYALAQALHFKTALTSTQLAELTAL
jgi:hypothetical protein